MEDEVRFLIILLLFIIISLIICFGIGLVARLLECLGYPWLLATIRDCLFGRRQESIPIPRCHSVEEGGFETVVVGESSVHYHVETASASGTEDEAPGPSNRVTSENDNFVFSKERCLLCQRSKGSEVTSCPSNATIEIVIGLVNDRYKWADQKTMNDCYSLVQSRKKTADLAGGWWHRKCYQEFGSIQRHARVYKRFQAAQLTFQEAVSSGEVSQAKGKEKALKRKLSDDTEPESIPQPRMLRSKVSTYDKTKCIFCVEDSRECLHRVLSLEMNRKMDFIKKNTKDEKLGIRFALIEDSVADDVLYHRSCFVVSYRVVTKDTSMFSGMQVNAVADVQLLDWLVNACHVESEHFAIDSNSIHKKYIDFLVDSYASDTVTSASFGPNLFKKHIKSLIEDNLTGCRFVPSFCRNEPDILSSEKGVAFAVNAAIKEDNSVWELQKVAQSVRSAMSSCPNWKFSGDYTYESPLELRYLLKLIMFGDKTDDLTEAKLKETNQTINIISQLISVNYKSQKSIRESSTDFVTRNDIRKQRRYHQNNTPLSIGLGVLLHAKTGTRSVIDYTSGLNMTCKYQTIKRLEHQMLKEVLKHNISEDGVYIPKNMSKTVRPFFAVDNADFKRASKDGKGELHGTLIVMFQNNPESVSVQIALDEDAMDDDRPDDDDERLNESVFSYKTNTCYTPVKPDTRVRKFRGTVYTEEAYYGSVDECYAMMQTCDEKSTLPTWKVYNSKMSEKPCIKTTYAMLPLLKSSPTDWSTLYTALKICQGISTSIAPNKRTIITLDLQLYIKGIQLSDRIGHHIFLRVGELHVFFAMCHAIGKYITSSGLDKIYSHSGIYSDMVVSKILDGKNMKRCLDAFLILYSALYNILLKVFYEKEPEFRDTVVDICRPLLTTLQIHGNESINQIQQQLLEKLKSVGFFERFQSFRGNLQKEAKYLSNVVNMIGVALLYFRATRQKLWNLHLASQDSFVKYFLSLDLQNYGRMMPVHLTQLYELRSDDRDTWDFLRRNFVCNKSFGRFTGIGIDHALEQVNKELKGMGGVVGMTDDQMDKFCLIAPTKRAFLLDFAEKFDLEEKTNELNEDIHHEERGSHKIFHKKSVQSYQLALSEFVNVMDLSNSECCYNIVTHSILTNDSDILDIESIGENMYNNFIETRMKDGPCNVWDPMTKRKLVTFKALNKTVKLKVKGKLVNLKEERDLTTRLLVISRTRTNIDVSELFAKHEFSVVPHSLFDREGNMLKCDDKSAFLHGIEDVLSSISTTDDPSSFPARNFVILDGMGFVNQLKMKGCVKLEDLIHQFTKRIENEVKGKDHVALVFDSYDMKLSVLKHATWNTRHRTQIQFMLNSTTVIKDIKLKDLLSHPQNKRTLTKFFADSCERMFREHNKLYVIAFGKSLLSNVPQWNEFSHCHAEADTLIISIMHQMNQLIPDLRAIIVSPDTDVLMLALNYAAIETASDVVFELLTSKDRRVIPINPLCNVFGPDSSKSLLGFYVFTGCDQLSRFKTVTKERSFKLFSTLIETKNSHILDALSTLGNEWLLSDNTKKALEKLTILLYTSKKKDLQRYHDLTEIGVLRWELYSKYSEDNSDLPPTPAALRFHAQRANSICLYWKRLSTSLNPVLPSLSGNGWDEELMPVMTDELPAPESSLDLTVCKCIKSHCVNNLCSCFKNKLKCSEACQCQSCENEQLTYDEHGFE